MKTYFPHVGLACLAALVLLTAIGRGQVPLTTPEHAVLMEKKLKSAQRVLAGVARDDYADVAKQARTLMLLSQEAGWNVIQTGEYKRLSEDFRNTARQLEETAKDKNSDAVGLAYVKLSISCIDCHRHVRAERSRIGQHPDRAREVLRR